MTAAAPLTGKVGSPKGPGDCAIVGVGGFGIVGLSEDAGAVEFVLENAGTGGNVDKFKRGAGVLNRPYTRWV